MTWKCPECGMETSQPDTAEIVVCRQFNKHKKGKGVVMEQVEESSDG
jgi:hypothetical protein